MHSVVTAFRVPHVCALCMYWRHSFVVCTRKMVSVLSNYSVAKLKHVAKLNITHNCRHICKKPAVSTKMVIYESCTDFVASRNNTRFESRAKSANDSRKRSVNRCVARFLNSSNHPFTQLFVYKRSFCRTLRELVIRTWNVPHDSSVCCTKRPITCHF